MTVSTFLRRCRRTADDGACDDSQLKAVCAFLADAVEPGDGPEFARAVLDELAAAVTTARGWLAADAGPAARPCPDCQEPAADCLCDAGDEDVCEECGGDWEGGGVCETCDDATRGEEDGDD